MLLVIAPILALLVGSIHIYLWRRLVRDVSAPGGRYRRVGTILAVVMPFITILSLLGPMVGIPFEAEQVLDWPGMYWFVSLLYLLLCLLVGEALRPLLLRWLRGRARRAEDAEGVASGSADRPAVLATAGPGRRSGAEAEDGPLASSGVALAEAELVGAAGADERTREAAPDAGSGPGAGSDGGTDADAGADADGPAVADPAEISRRRLVARGIAITAGVVTAGTVGYGTYKARDLTTKHVTVRLANLPRAAHGYRIAVASDIHLGPIAGRSHCQRVVDALNDTQSDLITVVGDLVDGEVPDLRSAAAPLAQLRAREGSFFVTGNHEYYVDVEDWVAHVRELGLTPLENERRELPYFDLAGVNDLGGEGTDHGGPDLDAALGGRDTQRPVVLMAHQPEQIHEAVEYGVDLQLSGHTHGGQLWPATYIAALANPTLAGLEQYDDTQLYVSRGAGAWGPPVRIGADPDITVVTLASPDA